MTHIEHHCGGPITYHRSRLLTLQRHVTKNSSFTRASGWMWISLSAPSSLESYFKREQKLKISYQSLRLTIRSVRTANTANIIIVWTITCHRDQQCKCEFGLGVWQCGSRKSSKNPPKNNWFHIKHYYSLVEDAISRSFCLRRKMSHAIQLSFLAGRTMQSDLTLERDDHLHKIDVPFLCRTLLRPRMKWNLRNFSSHFLEHCSYPGAYARWQHCAQEQDCLRCLNQLITNRTARVGDFPSGANLYLWPSVFWQKVQLNLPAAWSSTRYTAKQGLLLPFVAQSRWEGRTNISDVP